jgi:hypothetical protein
MTSFINMTYLSLEAVTADTYDVLSAIYNVQRFTMVPTYLLAVVVLRLLQEVHPVASIE